MHIVVLQTLFITYMYNSNIIYLIIAETFLLFYLCR